MIIIRKAEINDANALWRIQTEVFQKYMVKYGDFQRNPAHMTLDRLKFNINYPYGQYYVIEKDGQIIGGIFAVVIDAEDTMNIAQFYLAGPFQKQGIGSKALQFLFAQNPQIKNWYDDTIYEEKQNVAFYLKHGFKIIDEEGYEAFEEEHEGLTFVILKKTVNNETNKQTF